MKNNVAPQLISIGKASKLLGKHIDTIRDWDTKGILKSVRTTPKSPRMYRIADIMNLIGVKGKRI